MNWEGVLGGGDWKMSCLGTYETGDTDLRAGVAELRERSVEQTVLLSERFDVCIGVRLCGLEGHVCISDLWDWRAERSLSAHGKIVWNYSGSKTHK